MADVSWTKEAVLSRATVTQIAKRGVTVAWIFTYGKTQVEKNWPFLVKTYLLFIYCRENGNC